MVQWLFPIPNYPRFYSEGMLHAGSTMPSRTGQTVIGPSQPPQAWQPGMCPILF